ncbi:MAG: KH domain-containing protein [Pyrinomonadaceae bacterium]
MAKSGIPTTQALSTSFLHMKAAVERIVKALVGDADAVDVSESDDGRKTVKFAVRVAPDDYGRVIGREGRTIKAIRSLLFIAGLKHGKRFHLDLIEE